MPSIFAPSLLFLASEGSSLQKLEAGSVKDVAAVDSVKDVVLLKRTSKELLSSKLEAGSIEDSVALM
jgi:hypothetical protein